MSDPAEPFDRVARRRQRDRAAAKFAQHGFLHDAVIADLRDRLAELGERPSRLLDLGGHDGRLAAAIGAGWSVVADPSLAMARLVRGIAVVADEDRFPFADASFDAVVSALSLHAVNDLPGALIQARRALRAGGVFVASLVAGATLLELRRDLIEIETMLTGRAAPRVLPMVDPAAAAALLQRAGFADPVSDSYSVAVRYVDLQALLGDVHGVGEANVLASRMPLRRDVLDAVAARFATRADTAGRVAVPVEIVTMTARAPRRL